MTIKNLSRVLLPYQQKWLADDSPVKIWEKSRRIGATWCEAADAVMVAGRKNRPMDYYFLAYSEEIAKEFIRDAAEWARTFNIAVENIGQTLLDNGEGSIKAQQILFASGKRVIGLPSRATSLRGRMGYCLLDEFAFHQQQQELIKSVMAFLMWGGKVRILSTHYGVDNVFNELINDCRAGRKPYSLHRTTLDDALEQGLYQRICLVKGEKYSLVGEQKWRQDLIDFYGSAADEELFCVPNESGGAYFPRLLVERGMDRDIPVLRLHLNDDFTLSSEEYRTKETEEWLGCHVSRLINSLNPFLKTSYGFDFGRSGDLSYLMVFQEQPDLVRRTLFALELRNVPFDQQRQILFYIGDRLPRFIGGAHDARGNGQYLAEVAAQRYGQLRITQVMLTQKWYLENMPKYKAGLEDKQVILPADSDLLDDHRAVEVVKGIPKVPDVRLKDSRGLQRHGDGAIASALAWYASCMDNGIGQRALGSMEFDSWGAA